MLSALVVIFSLAIAFFVWAIVAGGTHKSEQEQQQEDNEQIKWLEDESTKKRS